MLSLKLFSFFSLILVQVGVGIIYKLSQVGGKYAYSPSSALTIAEFIKLCISFNLIIYVTYLTRSSSSLLLLSSSSLSSSSSNKKAGYQTVATLEQDNSTEKDSLTNIATTTDGSEIDQDGPPTDNLLSATWNKISNECTWPLILHMSGLALLYCINNQLTFVLFLLVDPATLSLFKSWSTALSAMILWSLFSRPINPSQWASISLQIAGLIIVQYDPCRGSTTHALTSYALILLSTCITAVCSVWNERVIKGFTSSLHVQNATLYTVGTILNLLCFFFLPSSYPGVGIDPSTGERASFFAGYTLAALGVIVCNGLLGIVVTAVYKYADAIIKTFATASATAVLLFVNTILFAMNASLVMYLGTAVVFVSSYIYLQADKKQSAALDTNINTTNGYIRPDGMNGNADIPHDHHKNIPNDDVSNSSLRSSSLYICIGLLVAMVGTLTAIYILNGSYGWNLLNLDALKGNTTSTPSSTVSAIVPDVGIPPINSVTGGANANINGNANPDTNAGGVIPVMPVSTSLVYEDLPLLARGVFIFVVTDQAQLNPLAATIPHMLGDVLILCWRGPCSSADAEQYQVDKNNYIGQKNGKQVYVSPWSSEGGDYIKMRSGNLKAFDRRLNYLTAPYPLPINDNNNNNTDSVTLPIPAKLEILNHIPHISYDPSIVDDYYLVTSRFFVGNAKDISDHPSTLSVNHKRNWLRRKRIELEQAQGWRWAYTTIADGDVELNCDYFHKYAAYEIDHPKFQWYNNYTDPFMPTFLQLLSIQRDLFAASTDSMSVTDSVCYTGWQAFLLTAAPAIGSPKHLWTDQNYDPMPFTGQSSFLFDAMFNGVHADADAIIYPYCEIWDSQTWHAAQAFLDYRTMPLLNHQVSFTHVRVRWDDHIQHLSYPVGGDPFQIASDVVHEKHVVPNSLLPQWDKIKRQTLPPFNVYFNLHSYGGWSKKQLAPGTITKLIDEKNCLYQEIYTDPS